MKILFFSRRFAPHLGGVETHLKHICDELRSQHEVTIITEQHDLKLPLHEVLYGVNVWRIPHSLNGSKRGTWKWLLHHQKLLRSHDLWHVHDVFFWLLPFRFLFFWKRIFMTFHGYEPPGPPTKKQIFWHQLAALCTDGNICVGGFHQKWYGVDPTYVTYGGIEPIKKKHVATSSDTKKKIIFMGRLERDTGIEQYLNAFKLLQEKDHSYELDVYGDGPLHNRLTQQTKKEKLAVHFYGFISQPESQLTTAKIAFAAQYLAIINALANGVKVISYADTPLKKDYLQLTPFNKFITVASAPQQITEAVLEPAQKSVVKEAQQWASAQTWTNVTRLYEQLWQIK
jgi:glycosyltransferase involved in cell wall biosynthesis